MKLQMLKQALIAYVSNSVKAIWSVVAHPLTIVGSKNGNVKDYKIYGNSVQNGEPTLDNPVEVQSVGEYDEESGKYKVPITVRGKNILDMSNATVSQGHYLDSGGVASSSNTNFLKLSMIKVKPNTRYTISSNLYFYTIWFSSNNSLNGEGISKVNAYNVKKKKFTTPEGCNYIRVSFDLRTSNQGGQGVGVFKWAMLEVGEGDGVYEPYKGYKTYELLLDEPLRKVGDYTDTIDFEKKQVVRKIYREVITKVESKSSNGNVFLTAVYKNPYLTPVKIGGGTTYIGYALSNKFIQHIDTYSNLKNYDGYIMSYITSGGANRVAYTFKDTSINTVEEAQVAIGDGFEVCYVLATPEEESIELPTLPQFKGTTVYEAQTEIPPSGIQVQYY